MGIFARKLTSSSHLYILLMCLKRIPHRFLMLVGCIVAPEYLEEATMLDLAMLAIAIGLFALTIGYAVACDRL
jgi:hypothetical protein